jgi:O-antigen/teichoic acid export membrane protein
LKDIVNDIKEFISNFFNRKGGYVFSAIIISKLLGFILSVFVINHISSVEFGLVSYAYNIISFIAPFAGFGIFQSLSRFGPIQESQNKKRQLLKFIFGRGIIASILLACIVILFAGLLTKSLPESYNYLLIISSFIITHFIFEVIKINYRIYSVNKLFAYLEISHSIVLLSLGVLLSYFFDGYGYLISLVISPLIISFYIIIKNKIFTNISKIDYSKPYKKSLWIYGVYTSLGGLTSQLIFSIDILTIGFLIKDPTSVALYKTASLIPFALLFIPAGVMKTDLVKIAQNYKNKVYLKKYAANYLKVFFLLSIVIYPLLHFFSHYIMSLFGKEYIEAANLIPVFALGLVGAFLFRQPFGNIITSVGWAKTNTVISIVTLILDIILNIIFVKHYGIIGAAYSTCILLWVAGLLSYLAFNKYLSTLD